MRAWLLLSSLLLTASFGLYGKGVRASEGNGTAMGRSSGCGNPVSNTARFPLNAVDGNNRRRTYVVHIPPGYDPAKPYPLIFVFHAAGGNAAQAMSWGLQSVSGAAQGAIFAFPNGIAYKNFGVGWDDRRDGYDLAFFDTMVDGLENNFCINRSRIFATGFSWGGDFVTALICLRGGVLRGAQVNSATDEYAIASDAATYQNLPCHSPSRPITRFQHADGGDPQYPAPLFATTSKLFQQLNHCTGAPADTRAAATTRACFNHSACATPYSECVFPAALGHTLPPHWAADTWAFFSSL